MQVILQKDVKSLGKAGETVSVKDGYGRNYLLPQGKAVVADTKNLRMLEHQKREIGAKLAKVKKEAEGMAGKLNNVTITIERETSDDEKLFGSVTSKDIAQMLLKQGININRQDIQMDSPIKNIGVYDVPVKLHSEVSGSLKVWVVKKQAQGK